MIYSVGITVMFSMLIYGISQLIKTSAEISDFFGQKASFWNTELQVRVCAEKESGKRNLNAALQILSKGFPENKNQLSTEYEALNSSLDESFPSPDATIDTQGRCRHVDLPHTVIHPVLQSNPSLPKNWPNWSIVYDEE